MEAVIAIVDHAGVANRDEREQTLSATQDPAKLVDGVVGVATLKGPEHPRVERVVARAVRDVRDAGEKLSVEHNARSLHAEMVQASDRLRWLHPRDTRLL